VRPKISRSREALAFSAGRPQTELVQRARATQPDRPSHAIFVHAACRLAGGFDCPGSSPINSVCILFFFFLFQISHAQICAPPAAFRNIFLPLRALRSLPNLVRCCRYLKLASTQAPCYGRTRAIGGSHFIVALRLFLEDPC